MRDRGEEALEEQDGLLRVLKRSELAIEERDQYDKLWRRVAGREAKAPGEAIVVSRRRRTRRAAETDGGHGDRGDAGGEGQDLSRGSSESAAGTQIAFIRSRYLEAAGFHDRIGCGRRCLDRLDRLVAQPTGKLVAEREGCRLMQLNGLSRKTREVALHPRNESGLGSILAAAL